MAGPRPLDEQFEDSYSQRATLRPSTGLISRVQVEKRHPEQRRGGIKKNTGVAMQTTGTTMRGAGVAMQGGGKAVKAGGKAMTRAGAALSATGVGAVVGVPMMAVGAGAQAVGTGVDAAGRATRKTGKAISRRGRQMKRRARGGQKVVVAAGAIKEKLEISKLNFSIWSWNLFLYFFFQLPFAIMNLVFFGFAYLYLSFGDSIKAIADGDGIFSFVARVVGKVIEGTAKTISGAISFLSGGTIDLGKIFDGIASLPTDFYMVTQGIMMGFGLFVMLVVGLIYLSNGFNPLFGRGAALKTSTFILCLIGYVIPGLNLFPWVLLWTGAVWLNPR